MKKKQVVITSVGFATIKSVAEEEKTDVVIFVGTEKECEDVLHGGKK